MIEKNKNKQKEAGDGYLKNCFIFSNQFLKLKSLQEYRLVK